ncbi:sulfotransferase family protein [Rhodobacter sp. JA431]|uniref:sulfotransferase family 2 domain-containing protein n=1 Tax=Rhodobacter sp. JA431 TaxID=570013 RepID=UPI000BDC871E|nr:sulfotransferase family 2 domain-containing protein [Rhodobacter sp. JA431]SOB97691.1 sulfotransferase family protein [Rhodobacter sp. JA431]
MIISDMYQFAFIHIPKCAGTTVRNMLLDYDDLKGAHTSRIDTHPVLGHLDYVHIPLFTLREHFPDLFAKVTAYQSFTIVRDPYSRFTSALFQRIDRNCPTPARLMTQDELEHEACKVMEFLRENGGQNVLLPPEYIHFQRQSDFIFLNGEKVLDAIYTTQQIDLLQTVLEQKIGQTLRVPQNDTIKNNKSQVFKNDTLRVLFRYLSPLQKRLVPLLPASFKAMTKQLVFKERKSGGVDLAKLDDVRAFVEEYYAEDLLIMRSLEND